MKLDLGALFIQHAGAPMRDASGCLAVRRVKEALLELTEEKLKSALSSGIEVVAKRVGVKPRAVEAALPWDEINALLPRIAQHQPVTLDTWNMHAGRLGGFLTGIVDVTMEKGLPEAGWYLDRLASKVSRDRELSEPIDAFAADVMAWDALLKKCGRRVDSVPAFVSAYQFRRVRRGLLALLALGSLGVVVAYVVRVGRCRARVEAALAAEDPCTSEAVDPSDLSRATAAQIASLHDHQKICDARRARADYEARCDALVQHVEAGALSPDDAAGAQKELLDRIAKGSLGASDLTLDPTFPCADVPSSKRFWPAFVKAAAASTSAWQGADAVSPKLAETLRTKGPPLAPEVLQSISDRAEITAHKGLISGDAATIDDAKHRCAFCGTLGIEQGASCKRLLVVLASMGR